MLMNKKLKQIYQQVPNIECKGLCHTTCGVIPLSNIENKSISNQIGYDFNANQLSHVQNGSLTCPLLKEDKCSIYNNRPLVCRLYGVVEKMKCIYGCKPVKYLDEKKARRLIKKLESLGDSNV